MTTEIWKTLYINKEMSKKILLSFAIFLLCCTIANSYAINDGSESDMVDNKELEMDVPLHKRSFPLSLNGDLRTLARMLYTQQRRRRVDNLAVIRQRLYDLGKRSRGVSADESDVNDNETDDNIRYNILRTRNELNQQSDQQDEDSKTDIEKDDDEFRKRSQRLSINGALSSLSDMLAASGRRRFNEEMALNQQRLMNLGK